MRKKRYGVFLLASLLIVLMILPSGCVRPFRNRQDASPHINEPPMGEREGDEGGDALGEELTESQSPLVIKSTNPVMTDKDKILEELDKEISELLKDLDNMDDIKDDDLNL
jgi:hypothetical protein